MDNSTFCLIVGNNDTQAGKLAAAEKVGCHKVSANIFVHQMLPRAREPGLAPRDAHKAATVELSEENEMAGIAPRALVPTDLATPDNLIYMIADSSIYTIADGALRLQQDPLNI